MIRAIQSLLPALLLLAFTAKAFVPVGMMLNVRSYMIDGVLVTICSSAGDLPWMPVHSDYDSMNDGAPNDRCPMAGPDAAIAFDVAVGPAPPFLPAEYRRASSADLLKTLIEKPAARAPPIA